MEHVLNVTEVCTEKKSLCQNDVYTVTSRLLTVKTFKLWLCFKAGEVLKMSVKILSEQF